MARSRYYYSDTISDFLGKANNSIIGDLTIASQHDINDETTMAWLEEIDVMKKVLVPYSNSGSIFFEYNIPRMGRRIDVVTIIDGIIFLFEFKAMNEEFSREAFIQVWDYALDLKNFQLGSKDRIIIPILVATQAPDSNCRLMLSHYEDNVYEPMLSNASRLGQCIKKVLDELQPVKSFDPVRDLRWARSGYEPTPTIVEAAIALYNHHSVEDITKHDADLEGATKKIDDLKSATTRLI